MGDACNGCIFLHKHILHIHFTFLWVFIGIYIFLLWVRVIIHNYLWVFIIEKGYYVACILSIVLMVMIFLICGCFINFFLSYIKLSQRAHLTDYQRNRDVILNIAKDYCENDEERLRWQARDKYRNLTEEEKNKKRKYGKKQIL